MESNKELWNKWKHRLPPLYTLESKRKKLTDILLDVKITKDAYDVKYDDITRKISKKKKNEAFMLRMLMLKETLEKE